MEQRSNRLYTGPLSQAAQKVLAVLRAQSLHGARCNQSYSSNHRQMERCSSSQKRCWSPSSWSNEERRDEYNDGFRLPSRPQVSSFSTSHHNSFDVMQSSETLASNQYSHTPDSSLSSQASSCSSSCWDSSLQRQTTHTGAYYQCSQTYSHRKSSEPPAYRSNRALSFYQHEVPETAATFCHRNGYISSLQEPDRLCEHQATPWRNSSEKIRPSFTLGKFAGRESPDETLFVTTEQPNSHEEKHAEACHPVSFCLKISDETDNSISGPQKENTTTESWNIGSSEQEDTVASGSQLKWKQPLSDPTEETRSGAEDGGILYQHLEPKTITSTRVQLLPVLTRHESGCDAHSLQLMRNILGEQSMDLTVDPEMVTDPCTGQISNPEHEIQEGVNEITKKERGYRDVMLLNKKGSGDTWVLGTNKNTRSELNLSSAIVNKIVDSDSKGEKIEKEEEKDFEHGDNTSEIKEPKHPPENKAVRHQTAGPKKIPLSSEVGNHRVSHSHAENPQDVDHTVTEAEEKELTGGALVQSEPTDSVLGADNLERTDVIEVRLEVETESWTKAGSDTSTGHTMETGQPHCSDIQPRTSQSETNYEEVIELPGIHTELRQRGEGREVLVAPPVDSEDKSESAEDSQGERCPTPTLSQECGARGSGFKAPCLCEIQQNHDNIQAANGNTRESSSGEVLAPASSVAPGQNSTSVQDLTTSPLVPNEKEENRKLPTSHTQSHRPPVMLSFPLKRKHEALQHHTANPPPKICLIKRPKKWEPPRSQEKAGAKGAAEWERAKMSVHEPQTNTSPSHETGGDLRLHTEPHGQKQTEQIIQRELKQQCKKSAGDYSKQTPFCNPRKRKWAKCEADPVTNNSKSLHEEGSANEPQTQSKAGYLTATLTSDPRVQDCGKLNPDEKVQMLKKAAKAKVLVLTMVYRDGTTQLDPEQKLTPPVCGLLLLMKSDLHSSTPEDTLGPNDCLVYLKLEHTPAWAQQQMHQSEELFTRDMLLQVLSRSQLVVCYKAKDLLRTALQFYRQHLNWKQVAGCLVQDPHVAGWLLDPADPASCYQDLLNKHCSRPRTTPALGTHKVSQVISGLCWLYRLNMNLCAKLQSQGLWKLYSDMELKMIPVLAAMESHHIHVDKEALKKTSDLLGTKMKQLEQEAHRAAGQIFLVTSNTQLRAVLFEKLRLHERCENKKLPKTVNKQQQSTSEAALLQLQDLHPLPKIILEYRQVHKIKSTFVDGILSCMMSKNYISSTWYQTSAVTGRISAKHPNFQALPRQPLQISKKQHMQGKEEEVVAVHPRAMFIPREGWTFLAADFCQVELRLLAHLSSDPELLRIFTNPQADVFTMLASQWKGVSQAEVTPEDREHAKRIVYSVVYGAGRERLSGILGVSTEQASRFHDSFLQTYREVQAFIQRTIQQSHRRGYVLSIMGRRRTLPNINSPDWGVRMQAERQAVNFVVQGSAADLCKTAMIRIFDLISSSGSLSARLIAQLHDELLYEVEDSQVEQFAAVVRGTMESLQHIDHLGVHLKVPLKVAVSSGKSWGSMSELNIPLTFPSP